MSTPWTPPGQELPEQGPAPQPQPQPAAYPPPVQPYPAYPAGPQPQGPPPSKTMAGWSLGLAIFGCSVVTWVLAVIFAIQVLARSSRERLDHGRGLAIAALVIAGLWAVGGVLSLISYTMNAPHEASGPDDDDEVVVDTRTGEELPRVIPSKLRLGDCFNDSALAGLEGDDTVVSDLVTVVPCPRLHEFEAYQLDTIAGDDFPGEEAVGLQAAKTCAKAFKPYVGAAYGPSELEFWAYYPTQQSWQLLDDHGITCVLGQPGTKTAGSLKGSRR